MGLFRKKKSEPVQNNTIPAEKPVTYEGYGLVFNHPIIVMNLRYIIGKQPKKGLIHPPENSVTTIFRDGVPMDGMVEGDFRLEDYSEEGKYEISAISVCTEPVTVEAPLDLRIQGMNVHARVRLSLQAMGDVQASWGLLQSSRVKPIVKGSAMIMCLTSDLLLAMFAEPLSDVLRLILVSDFREGDKSAVGDKLIERLNSYPWFKSKGLKVISCAIGFRPEELAKVLDSNLRERLELLS